MQIWKTISTKQILAHKRLSVYEDIVQLPNGKTTDYIHFGEPRHAVCVIVQDKQHRFLIQKEYNYPPNESLYQFPGGILDGAESPADGAMRELAEEAGITGQLELIGDFYMDPRRRRDKLYVFICTQLAVKLADKDDEEEFEEIWISEKEVEHLISKGEIVTAMTLAAWTLYKTRGAYHRA